MRRWGKNDDRKLERRLRAERPQARESFVELLSRQTPEPRPQPRRRAVPRVALVAAVTLVIAASLGAAGAVGYMTTSLHSFGNNVVHIVKSDDSYKGKNDDRDGDPGRPFRHQYGFPVLVCHNGHPQFVPIALVIRSILLHDGEYLPLFTCIGRT